MASKGRDTQSHQQPRKLKLKTTNVISLLPLWQRIQMTDNNNNWGKYVGTEIRTHCC